MCDGQVGPIATIHVDDLDNDTARSLLPANEITLRRKLACLYRILDHFGWTQVIYNHITVYSASLITKSSACIFNRHFIFLPQRGKLASLKVVTSIKICDYVVYSTGLLSKGDVVS